MGCEVYVKVVVWYGLVGLFFFFGGKKGIVFGFGEGFCVVSVVLDE